MQRLDVVPTVSWGAPTVARQIADQMRKVGLPMLDGACIRWDAAERCLVVWTLDGREVRFK